MIPLLQLIGGSWGLPPDRAVGRYNSIYRRQGNFKLVDFVPLLFGALSLRNGEKLLQSAGRRDRFWFIHDILIRSFTDNCYHL